MESRWKLGGLTWKELGTRIWTGINEHDVFGRAAQLAYYFLLALFPLLLFLTTLLGYLAEAGTELRKNLLTYLASVMPSSASHLVNTTVDQVTQSRGGGKLSFGILAALWAASNGMGAMSESLNSAYDVKETRAWWKSRLVAIALTIALSILIISSLTLVLYGGQIAESIANRFGFGDAFTVTWKIAQWPIVLAFVLLAFAMIYYFAPDVKDQKWTWVSPGTVLALILWLLVSFAFRLYLSYFDSYSATYGSLGAVIILMLWFYLTGAAILIGGVTNSEIEHTAAQQGAPDAKQKGEMNRGDKQAAATNANQRQANQRQAKSANAAAPRRNASQPSASHQSSTLRHNTSREDRSLSVRKVAVVAGAWLLAKFSGRR